MNISISTCFDRHSLVRKKRFCFVLFFFIIHLILYYVFDIDINLSIEPYNLFTCRYFDGKNNK